VERFLTALLIQAGVAPSQAAQLARAYLINHGVPVSPITAQSIVEALGFELAGGRVQQTVGAAALTGGGSAALFAVEVAPPTAGEQEQIAQAVAEASGGAVSPQAVASSGLSPIEAAAFGQYQSAQQTGEFVALPAEVFAYLESHGFIDTTSAGFNWYS
jgi:hypothetical protein